jgi:beta-lactamase regulating signal transducer with metallopeptidase domain
MTATQWLEVIASYSLQVLIVVAAGNWLERAVVRSSDRCAVWNTCFFSILVLGCAALLLPRLHLIQPWSQLEPHTLLTFSDALTAIGQLLLATWFVGASVSLIKWLARGRQLRRALSHCTSLPAQHVQLLLGITNSELSNRSLPSVLISDEVDGPFCWQLHQATVVLPRYLLEGSRDDIRHVLIHELEHLKTNHPFQLFLQHLAEVVCWFHPAVWKASERASLMREFTCDDAAAAEGANSAAYLRTLLHIAERCGQRKNASTIGFGRTPSEIVVRARRLVDLANGMQLRRRHGLLGRKSAMLILLLLTCLLTQLWVPCDTLASSRSIWSPWPAWTANSLHCFGYCLRDYEVFDRRVQPYEILYENSKYENPSRKSSANRLADE